MTRMPQFFARLTGLLLLLVSAAAQALQLTDDRGIVVTFAQSPQRIVSVLPSLTETVCELGQCPRLVGADRYSNYPDRVRTLPKVGGGLDPNIEAIIALKPDVVLLATSSPAAARLESLGIKVVALEPRAMPMPAVCWRSSASCWMSRTRSVWRAMDAGVSAAAQSIPERARNARVYFEVNSAPYAAGESSFIGETLTRLGARNIVPAALGPFPKSTPSLWCAPTLM